MFSHFADNTNKQSIASKLRQQRFQILLDLIESFPGNVTILDVGGRLQFWEMMLSENQLMDKLHITLLNIEPPSSPHPNFASLVGDGRSMPQFEDKQFNIVFSNSTIEHVGSFADQQQMANEVKRVGQKYVIQTPNRYFPIEPHFVFPYFQFLPLFARAWLLQNFNLGWYTKTPDYQEALRAVEEIRLLSKTEFRCLFPDVTIFEEKLYGLVKSFIAYTPVL